MQGSDFINVSIVPLFDVNQFDLGDVFISPCRAGTYNDIKNSFCKDCSVCTYYQFEKESCIAVRNRICLNCTICTEREQELCQCSSRTPDCVTGDRVCQPLPPTSANITFDLTVSVSLSPLKERFLQEGMRTGFVLFLSEYLQHNPESIMLVTLTKVTTKIYLATYIVNDVYSLFTKNQVQTLSQAVVQTGLTGTFGVQSNTFATVSQQRRRLLQQQGNAIVLSASNVSAQCVPEGTCGRFFTMSNPETPCNSTCISLPCPPGYTGLYGFCDICPNATFKSSLGSEACTGCPLGMFSNQGSFSLEECWSVPTTTTAGVTTSTMMASTTSVPVTGGSVGNTQAVLSEGILSGTVDRNRQFSSSANALTSSRTTSIASLPLSTSESKIPSIPVSPTPAPPTESGGAGNNYYFFNVTYLREYLLPSDWNGGKASTVQYITINQSRDEWVLNMAGFLMLCGIFSLAAIGSRLFLVVGRGGRGRSIAVPQRRILLPIHVPKHVPVNRGHDSDSGSDQESGGKNPDEERRRLLPAPRHIHEPPAKVIPTPPGPFLSRIQVSRTSI